MKATNCPTITDTEKSCVKRFVENCLFLFLLLLFLYAFQNHEKKKKKKKNLWKTIEFEVEEKLILQEIISNTAFNPLKEESVCMYINVINVQVLHC